MKKRDVLYFIKQHRDIRIFNRHWEEGKFFIPDGRYREIRGGYEITGKNSSGERDSVILYARDLFLWEIFYD